jgi:hypothetical protein
VTELGLGVNFNTLLNLVGIIVLGLFIPAVRAGLTVLREIRKELTEIKIATSSMGVRLDEHGERIRSLERVK